MPGRPMTGGEARRFLVNLLVFLPKVIAFLLLFPLLLVYYTLKASEK